MNGLAARNRARTNPMELLRHEEDNWDEPELPERGAQAELGSLQGPWLSVAGRRQAELLIAGGHYTIRFEDGLIYMGVLELDPSARPKTMHMRIDEGPAHHKGKTALCLYELTGDTLRWCSAVPGKTEKLAAFPAENDPNYLCLVFRHVQPFCS